MKKLKLILTLTVLTTFFSCVNGDDYGTPDLTNQCMDLTKTKEVFEKKKKTVKDKAAKAAVTEKIVYKKKPKFKLNKKGKKAAI